MIDMSKFARNNVVVPDNTVTINGVEFKLTDEDTERVISIVNSYVLKYNHAGAEKPRKEIDWNALIKGAHDVNIDITWCADNAHFSTSYVGKTAMRAFRNLAAVAWDSEYSTGDTYVRDTKDHHAGDLKKGAWIIKADNDFFKVGTKNVIISADYMAKMYSAAMERTRAKAARADR